MQIKRLLSEEKIASQIAELVNSYNRWRTTFTSGGINRSSCLYIVESYEDLVIGVCGVQRVNNKWSEVKHLVVRPEMRGTGLAKRLVGKTVEESKTSFVYANVRSDNVPSLKTFLSLKFFPYKQVQKSGYNLITFARFTNNDENEKFILRLQCQNSSQ